MRTKQSERMAKIADSVALPVMLVAPDVAQPAPFLVGGWINCAKHDRMNDPSVTVANLNTSEVFIAGIYPSSNHAPVMTDSLNVSTGDVLRFNASNGNLLGFDHTATVDEVCAGGFARNDTIECGEPAGVCGDVDDNTNVDMTDAMVMWYGITDYPIPGECVW
jgi:hypothetical protein